MSIVKFTTLILSLPEDCKKMSPDNNTLTFKLPVKPHECPVCHTHTTRIHDYRLQKLKGIDQEEMSFIYRRRRYRCPQCGKVFSEKHPFIARYQQIPYSATAAIIHAHTELLSSSAIARRHAVSATTVQRIFKNVSPTTKTLDEAISIDEFRGNTGAKFQVVINSLTRYTCLNILSDRSSESLYQEVMEYPMEERMKVKYVSIDLSASFRKMIQECFPNAQIAADKFHAVRMANDALDTVRKEVQQLLGREHRKWFRRSRYLLLTREKNLQEKDRDALSFLLNHSSKLSDAYAMKEAYFSIFDSTNEREFTERLGRFRAAAEKTKISGFKTLLNTTIRWRKEILTGILHKLNNGFTEGCNTTIKTLKRISYGYRNFENFKRKIIFLLNDKERRLRRAERHAPAGSCA